MSTTFFVSNWDKQSSKEEVVFMDHRYPNLEPEDFENDPYVKKDENGRLYEIEIVYENPFPDLTVCNSVRSSVLNALGYADESTGEFKNRQLNEVMKRLISVVNSHNKIDKFEVQQVISGNFIDYGVSSERLKRKLVSLMDLVKFAIDNKKYVYWG